MSHERLLITFQVGREFFGVDVTQVQEVAGTPAVTVVPMAPAFVLGLINLRGQLATSVGLRELFGVKDGESGNAFSVVCRMDGGLVSLAVDAIGDVIMADQAGFERPPETMPVGVRSFVSGVYKLNGSLLSLLDLNRLAKELSPTVEGGEGRLQAG